MTKGSIQKRANQLVRELHALEETASEALRVSSVKNTSQAQRKPNGTQQTGLLSFYGAKGDNAERPIEITENDEPAGKRKSDQGLNGDEPKKQKTDAH